MPEGSPPDFGRRGRDGMTFCGRVPLAGWGSGVETVDFGFRAQRRCGRCVRMPRARVFLGKEWVKLCALLAMWRRTKDAGTAFARSDR